VSETKYDEIPRYDTLNDVEFRSKDGPYYMVADADAKLATLANELLAANMAWSNKCEENATLRKALDSALETCKGIVDSDWRKWEELASPEEYERWSKSRANHTAVNIRAALIAASAHEPQKENAN